MRSLSLAVDSCLPNLLSQALSSVCLEVERWLVSVPLLIKSLILSG